MTAAVVPRAVADAAGAGPSARQRVRRAGAGCAQLEAVNAKRFVRPEPLVEVPEHGFLARAHRGTVPGANGVAEGVAHRRRHRLVGGVVEVTAERHLAEARVGERVEDELVPGLIDQARRHTEDRAAAPGAADEPLAQALF